MFIRGLLAVGSGFIVSFISGVPPNSISVDEVRVRAVAAEIIAADNARDIERVLALYADDAVLMPPNDAPAKGKAAFKPRYQKLFATTKPEIVGHIDEATISGDLAFVAGSNTGRFASLNGGASRILSDAYVMILRRDKDGGWRITRLIWHPNIPPKT